jgi:hypothetical protein
MRFASARIPISSTLSTLTVGCIPSQQGVYSMLARRADLLVTNVLRALFQLLEGALKGG